MSEDTGIELVNSIATDKLGFVGRDLGEVALDTVLKEDILRDITVFHTIAALYQAGVEIHHQFFVRKVITKG
jgi:hypothetical protein